MVERLRRLPSWAKVGLPVLAVVIIAAAVAAGSNNNTGSRARKATTITPSATVAPTTQPPTTVEPATTQPPTSISPASTSPTPLPPTTTAAAPKTVASLSGSSDKTSATFTVGVTWQLSWNVKGPVTPTVEIFDNAGTSLGRIDTGGQGPGSTLQRQACTCFLKVSVFGPYLYTFSVIDLPGGAPIVGVPATFTGTGDKATAYFTTDGTWTLSWTVHTTTSPVVDVIDASGNSVDNIDTVPAGSGSTVEHVAGTYYLMISVTGQTTYAFRVTAGG